jgi:predicted hydrocarbon binding protein
MENIFIESMKHENFTWSNLGDIIEGRGDLGEEMPVLVYRLMQYTMLDVLSKAYGSEKANEHFQDAGFLAGSEFAKNTLDLNVDLSTFLSSLQQKLKELKIGILRVEAHNKETGEMMMTVGQDLDCSGIPITNETVCNYDEGFISGILKEYTGKSYKVSEIDCWANGDRVCRFHAKVSDSPNK